MADNDKTVEPIPAGPRPRDFTVPGNDLTGYIGVAPEYMNYANPVNKPYLTETEAYLYTNLTDEEIDTTRGRDFEDGEMPAIAEDTWDESALVSTVGGSNQVTLDPVAGPRHPGIVSDADAAAEDAEKKDDEPTQPVGQTVGIQLAPATQSQTRPGLGTR